MSNSKHKPDTELLTMDELWNEITKRTPSAILIVSNSPGHDGIEQTRFTGELPTLLGFLVASVARLLMLYIQGTKRF